jgi:hypothetical protein
METVLSVLAGLGLAAACGFRVFVPLLVASIAIHSGHLEPTPAFAWLGSTPALVTFSIATALEVGGYYIPWLDHFLDSVSTPAAVVAGTILTASLAVDMDPFLQWTLGVVAGGGIAATVQAGSVITRGFSFMTSGGLTNPVVSTVELGGAIATSAMAIVAPALAMLGLVALAMVVVTFIIRRHRARSLSA